MCSLPDDLLLHVLSYLKATELASTLPVCRRFSRIGGTPGLWRSLHRRRTGPPSSVADRTASAWKDTVRGSGLEGEPAGPTEYGAATAAVWTMGADRGPEDWGVPTPPPHRDFGQTGIEGGDDGDSAAIKRLPLTPLPYFSHHGSDPVRIGAGGYHTAVCLADGSVCTFGSNSFGQLGTGTRRSSSTPTLLSTFGPGTAHRVVEIACGYAFTMFLTDAGTLFSCGFNNNGRCGVPDSSCTLHTADGDGLLLEPTEVEATAGVRVVNVACGSGHAVALSEDGTLLSWGRNCSGQLGRTDRRDEMDVGYSRRTPHEGGQWEGGAVDLPGGPVTHVSCAAYSTVALTKGGRVYQWGRVHSGITPLPYELVLRQPLEDGDKFVCANAGEILLVLATERGAVYLGVGGRLTPFARIPGVGIRHAAVSLTSIVLVTDGGGVLVWGGSPPREGPITAEDVEGKPTRRHGSGKMFVLVQTRGVRFVDVGLGSQHCVFLSVVDRKLLEAKRALITGRWRRGLHLSGSS